MTVLSGGLSLIPPLNGFFTVNSRLAGFFQYPNTFALYLLAGIILTGSRTGFVLFAVTVVCFCFILRDRRIRIGLACGLVLIAAAAGIEI